MSSSSVTDKLLLALVPPFAHGVVNLLGWTGRFEIPVRADIFPGSRSQGPSILVCWHSRALMHLYYYRDLKINAFISQHRDGELLARTLIRFGYEVIRGSSTRGGFEGMRDLLRVLKRGHDVALAPDGPRGPAQIVSPGVIAMARLSGRPIRPVAYGAKWAFRAKSWDKFMVPLPFSAGAVVWGPPIYVPRNANVALAEEKRMELQHGLNDISHKADQAAGRQG